MYGRFLFQSGFCLFDPFSFLSRINQALQFKIYFHARDNSSKGIFRLCSISGKQDDFFYMPQFFKIFFVGFDTFFKSSR